MVDLVKGGIKVTIHIQNPTLDVEEIIQTVKIAQGMVFNTFDYTLQNVEIDIYDSIEDLREEVKSRSRYASWIAGIYDGKIRVISEKEDEDPATLAIILTHEIIHYALNEITRGNCPYWLDEGLAVYLSQDLPPVYSRHLLAFLKKDKCFPLEILERPLLPKIEEALRQLAYAQVFSLTEFIVESQGWDKIRFVLTQSRRRPINIILGDLGLNYYLLEQSWRRWLMQKTA